MTPREDALAWLAGAGPRPACLLDLTAWYRWHSRRGTLPAGWEGYSLAQVTSALGVPVWQVARPWRSELVGVESVRRVHDGERTVAYRTVAGELEECWSLGPDEDWWQMEYPVKCVVDLPPAHALVAARRYLLEPEEAVGQLALIGDAGVLAYELPMRPYSDILHTLLGWGEGLLLWRGDGQMILQKMLWLLEEKLQALVAQVAGLPGSVVLSPDNLDGRFISPRVFGEHLAASYRRTADLLHAGGKRLVVHCGGPVGRLLPLLAEAGVDVVEGVAGPPQGDTALPDARAAAGPGLVLWGGIPQDLLLDVASQDDFARALAEAARVACADPAVILGIADRVPAAADLGRLQALIAGCDAS